MPFIIIHNGDDQATNFIGHVNQGTPGVVAVVQATFNGGDFDAGVFQAATLAVGQHGRLNLIWAGHGAGNDPRGTPLTDTAHRIRAENFRRLFEILQPAIVVFFSCNAGLWIERQAYSLVPIYTAGPRNVTMFGYRVPIQGLLRFHVGQYLQGVQLLPLPASGALVQLQRSSTQLRIGPHPGLAIQNRGPHAYSPGGFHEV